MRLLFVILFFVLLFGVLFLLGWLFDWLCRRIFHRRVRAFRIASVVVCGAITVALIWGSAFELDQLRVTEVEVCSPRVPKDFEGYRIVQFSDLHINPARPKRYERLVEKISELRPDLIVNTGDIVSLSERELTPEIAEILSHLSAPDGVWSIWGNHDLGFYLTADSTALAENFTRLEEKIHGMGWKTLSDESAYIHRGADSILLTGLDFPGDGTHRGHNTMLAGADLEAAYKGIEGQPFNVVLAHTPQMWQRITAQGRGDLTLSGHTHAMQFKLFGWSPASYLYDEWSGRYEDDKKNVLYVNDGIGYAGIPIRIGARPQITIYTLK